MSARDQLMAELLERTVQLESQWQERAHAPRSGHDPMWDDVDLKNSKLGDQFAFVRNQAFGAGIGGPTIQHQLCRVQTRSGLARPWTVTLSMGLTRFNRSVDAAGNPILLNPARVPDSGHAYAVVRWGVDGAVHQAEVDWGIGTQFTLVASYVEVDVALPSLASDGGTEQAPLNIMDNTFHASVVPGAAAQGQGSLITRTLYLGNLAATTSGRAGVPAFARRWQVRYTNAVAGTGLAWQLSLFNHDLSLATARWSVAGAVTARFAWDATEWGWVVPNTSAFQLTNSEAATTMTGASVVFQLAL